MQEAYLESQKGTRLKPNARFRGKWMENPQPPGLTLFAKMAETWPFLLLLLAMCDPLLSTPLSSDHGNEAGAETAHPVTTRPVETPAASTSTSTSGSTDTPNSTTIGALVPHMNPGQRSTVKTLVETKPLNTKVTQPGDKGGFQCTPPTRRDGLVGQCLIAIAALAGLATIFIVCTIVLCTKLSSSKYKYKMAQRYGGTEMVCISSLLPDGNGTHRSLVSSTPLILKWEEEVRIGPCPLFPSHNSTQCHIKLRPNEKSLCANGPATQHWPGWRHKKEEEEQRREKRKEGGNSAQQPGSCPEDLFLNWQENLQTGKSSINARKLRGSSPISRGTMKLSLVLHLACVSVVLLWCRSGGATPFPFNMSSEGSGDGEPELLFPTAYSTRVPAPAPVSPTPRVTTIVRIKNFILNDVVDFLRENLLLIVVVSSLLIVIIFIVCCASVMSHKRKLNAYYPSSFPAKKYVDQKDMSGGSRTFSEVPEKARDSQGGEPVDSTKQFQTDISTGTKNLRTPSKALVGEKGKEPKSNLPPETKKSQEEKPKEEEEEPAITKKEKEEVKSTETKPSTSSSPSQPLVCLCHLKHAHPPKQDK
ncbi:hypothetical protein JZ751_001661 [Albula glossodonta]|uniref:Transmembrane protein 119 n=1 Tax=Albula glossodonta TaxID=121402 RepID=A0A8T2PUJ7_9TELE|nr:hypothetical protein JZ751_001661 [Albula glossodonta]